MKVIMLKDLRKVGKKGEIIECKDGYANNFLIKNGYAVEQTKGSMSKLNYEHEVEQIKEDEEVLKANLIKKELSDKELKFVVKTGPDGRVFGNITSKQISNELENEYGIKIDKKNIKLEDKIDTLGTTIVQIKLHKKVIIDFKIKLSVK